MELEGPFASADEARLRLVLAAKEKGNEQLADSVEAIKGRLILRVRICALWVIAWGIFVPVAVLAVWLVPRPPDEWTQFTVAIGAVICLVGFCVLMPISLLIMGIFLKPFNLVMDRFFGSRPDKKKETRH